MDRFTLMSSFVRAVEMRSLSAAARELGTTQPTVSKWLRALEAQTGARLLQRNTQGIRLTEAGERYYDTCKRVLSELERAEAEIGGMRGGLKGRLRLNVPVGIGEVQLARIAVRFQRQHKELKVDLQLTDRVVDLVEDGVDIAVRVGRVTDPSVVARSIGAFESVLVATPQYLKKAGRPKSLEELSDHPYLAYGGPGSGKFLTPAGLREVPVRSELAIYNAAAIKTAVLEHAGIGRMGRFFIDEEIRSGAVQVVLPGIAPPPTTTFAVYLPSPHLPEKIRAFVAFLIEEAKSIPGYLPAAPREAPPGPSR